MKNTDERYMIERQVDYYRSRVAATQGAIVNLCDKPLDDKSAMIRLEGLCTHMVRYRSCLNYWLAKLAACEAVAPVTGVTPRKCKMCKCETTSKRGFCSECIIELE